MEEAKGVVILRPRKLDYSKVRTCGVILLLEVISNFRSSAPPPT